MASWSIYHIVIDVRSGFDPPAQGWFFEMFMTTGAVLFALAWLLWVRHWRQKGAQ